MTDAARQRNERQVGIIGVGFIADAMVRGFLASKEETRTFLLSPRGKRTVEGLLADFPGRVRAAGTNQEVLNSCTTTILAVRPDDAESVLNSLNFRPDHHVISVIAGYGLERMAALVAPAGRVTLAIPLPSMAEANGTTILFPFDAAAAQLFRCGGPVVTAESEQAFACLGTVTAIMASHFRFAGAADAWLTANGVDGETSRNYLNALFTGLTTTGATQSEKSFAQLTQDHATPGSFNAFLLEGLEATGAFALVPEALDQLLVRMKGGE